MQRDFDDLSKPRLVLERGQARAKLFESEKNNAHAEDRARDGIPWLAAHGPHSDASHSDHQCHNRMDVERC